ncbi:OmpA family protein [Hanstruepera neustonica]|uniref:OmpA family protein n=1 Tax=Hanstruepera neustonica TaxID=1445657 RepID=A0A2K1E3K3_9FLAO|nr:OmpA family protein [Hanstruepera neustonica]PNQ74862.1 OmpA family protein [Hanstruepera neustonica]
MMNNRVFIFVILCFQLAFSQNLVLNPSFEEHKTCPRLIGGFNHNALDWSTPNFGSTDYFNACSQEVGETNFFGKQSARTGKGFAGMYVMAPDNYREYVQGQLSKPLLIGKTYTMTFYISLAENCSHAIRDLGVLFLKEPFKQNSDKLLNLNEVLNEVSDSYFVLINSQSHYIEKTGWEKITFEYTAKGFESNFIIGNFDKNSKVSKIKMRSTKDPDASYYYIDDVSIESLYSETVSYSKSQTIENDQVLQNDKVYTLQNVLFDFDKHELLESSKAELNQLYKYLNANKRLQIEIYGHTDDVGTQKRNDELSLLRAKEVALFLISKGLRPERITATGYGNKFPVANNDTQEGRALNRRVEFKLIFK